MDASPDRPSSEEAANTPEAPDVPGAAAADAAPDVSASDAPPEPSAAALEPPASMPAPDVSASHAATAAADAPRRGSAVSWLGFATAAIGLVLAAVGIAALVLSRENAVSALDARLAGAERVVRELASRAPPATADPKVLDEVTRRVAKLEATPSAAPSAPASDAALAARIAALEAEIKAIAATLGSVGRRDEEVLAVARDARARADASAAAFAELAQKISAATAARSEFEALANRVTAVERSEKAVERGDHAVRLALAATALNAGMERGNAFAAELATAKALGADAKLVAALEPFAQSGIPSAAALAHQLSALAPSLQPSSPREGVLARLQENAEKLVRIRRVDEPAGSDAAAIVARAEAKASRSDIAGAVSELTQLPPDARAPAEAWIRSAQARNAAIDASRRLAADAMSGLAK
jgi:hypothetical protein